MTLRGLMRGSLLYTLGNFLPRVGAFLLLPLYTWAMGPADFGVFSLMLSLSGLLAIVYRLGLDGALLRLHFDVPPRRLADLYGTAAATTLVAGLAFTAVLALVAAPVFGFLFAGVPFFPYGILTLGLTFGLAFQYVPAALFRATDRPGRFVAFAAGVFAVGTAAAVVFLVPLRLGALGGLLGQLAGALTIALVTAVVVLGLRPRRFDPGLARAALSFGLPLVPHGLSAWILNLSDRWLIGLFIGLPAFAAQAAVGIYAFGYVLGQAIALVAVSFNSAWSPFFYARGTGPRGPELLREMTSLSTAVLSVLAVTVAVLAPELTDVLARERWGDAAAAAADVVPIVALASLVYGIYFMVVSSLFLLHRTRVLPLLSAAAGAVNVAVNIALIPRIGITGAAWATLAGYGALTLGTYLYARRAYPIRLDVPRLATLFGLAIGVALLSRLVRPEDGLLLSGGVHLALAAGFGVAAVLVARGTVARLRAIVPLSTLGIAADRMAIPKEDA